MTQVWQNGKIVPITIIKAEPNKVSFVRTTAKDGYSAVQLQNSKIKREFRTENPEELGQAINVAVFKEGDVVRAIGTSKGRGFQGVVKRYGFGGGPKTHGQKNRMRAPGSIGSTAPQRVVPGRRMAGRMGNDRVTVKNLKVVSVDAEKNQIFLKGAVPGAPEGIILIQTVK